VRECGSAGSWWKPHTESTEFARAGADAVM
jgi:hypothetical protein